MRGRKIFLPAVMIAGSLGLSALPSWAQGTPGGARPSNPEQPRFGAAESVPGSRAGATQELSQNDMRLVQQRLEEKGYKTGNIDGTADDTTRAAIRKFQQDEGIPTTGTIDELTANRLGLRYAKSPADRGGTGEQSAPADKPSPR
jgi:peptidoglycan hydrolase-like protein with peptidoglycan-binding domain